MAQDFHTDGIDFRILGDDIQLVEVELDPGEGVRAEAGTMCYMGDHVKMQTNTGGGLFSGFKRMVTGESFFITTFAHEGSTGKAHVAFAAPYPGKIVPLDLDKHPQGFICQKDAFLCADQGVDIEVTVTKKIGAGLFGGEGFILQKLTGTGYAFVHAGGTIMERELKAGETLRVDTGCIAAFDASVDYDTEFIGGFKNALFGGEGLFLATLKGPGTVFLQSLPFARLADRILAGVSRNRGESTGLGGTGILGDLLSGDD
jgi:uncharacterized protein (TIGR00266 family)